MKSNVRVLLVDDEVDFLDMMAFWLKQQGYAVQTALDGESVIKLVKEGAGDIIFLDINMPELDGIETLRRIRKFNTDIPVIMVTAFGTEDRIKESQDLGISGFFPKDKDFLEAATMIEAVLKTHKGLRKQET